MPKKVPTPSYIVSGANNTIKAVNRKARRGMWKRENKGQTFKESMFSIPEIFPRGMKGTTKNGYPWYPGMDESSRDIPEPVIED